MQGGVGDYTAVLRRALAELGVETCVVTSTPARPQRGADDDPVFPVVRRWDWSSLRTVRRIAQEWRVDIVHVQYQAAPYGMRLPIHLLPRFLRFSLPDVRTAVTFHDLRLPYLFPKAGPARRWAMAALMRYSDAAIVTNREDEAALLGFNLQRTAHMIPIGSNIEPSLPKGFERAAWRSRWGIAESDVVLAYFGFLNASKGGQELITALGVLLRRGFPAKLLMIGGKVGASDATNREFAQQVEAQIEQEGVGAHVIWTGYLAPEEVSAAFAISDMAVLPYADGVSFRRGSLMAALAHGVPVITTAPRVHLPELLPEQNVVLVAPGQAGEIVEAVMRVADHAGLRTRLGEGARKLSETFRWEVIAQKTLAVYQAIVTSGRGP